MICARCGSEIAEGEEVCSRCGASMETEGEGDGGTEGGRDSGTEGRRERGTEGDGEGGGEVGGDVLEEQSGILPHAASARRGPDEKSVLNAAQAVRKPPVQKRSAMPPFASCLVPGLGQFANGEYGKALLMFLIWLVCTTVVLGLLTSGA